MWTIFIFIRYKIYKIFKKSIVPILCKLFNAFMKGESIHPRLKETTIILLHKKGDERNLDNWRPISLTNCDMKIFTKIITNRLNRIAQRVISTSQYGFIKGRSIIENIQIVNHCINK